MFCLGKDEQTVSTLSFTSYIFSVISEGGTTGLYVTGLYVLFCGDCLLIARFEIKRRMAFIVNKSDTGSAGEELSFHQEREIISQRHTVRHALLMLPLYLHRGTLILAQTMTLNKRLLYEIVHISAQVFLLS